MEPNVAMMIAGVEAAHAGLDAVGIYHAMLAAAPSDKDAGPTVSVSRELMADVISVLDKHLGDTDITHFETDDEVKDHAPLQWACSQLSALLAASSTNSPAPELGESHLPEAMVNMRRAIERGLRSAQSREDGSAVDTFQHLLNLLREAAHALSKASSSAVGGQDGTLDSVTSGQNGSEHPAAVARDAMRYRWLRSKAFDYHDGIPKVVFPELPVPHPAAGVARQVDDAIDLAAGYGNKEST